MGIEFTPTIPHCSMATLIGLSIKVKLLRSLPDRFKVCLLTVYVPGSFSFLFPCLLLFIICLLVRRLMFTSLLEVTPQRKQVSKRTSLDCFSDDEDFVRSFYFVGFCVPACSEQAAGRQRESGCRPGELVSAGGGQPVSEHQEHLSSV